MSDTGRKRPWLAAVLALVYPGLGHLYLRLWARSLMWFALVVTAVVLLVPESAVQPADGGFGATFDSMMAGMAGLSLESKLLLSGLTATEMLDAYLLARRRRARADGTACPSCGKDLDDELGFCPWCSKEL